MSHFIADDGAKIHVRVSGEGPPIVMLHGWTASHYEWAPFLNDLNRRHRVYRWDARGHGGHPADHGDAPTAERMARDFANLLDHYGLAKVAAVGHSMGALTLKERSWISPEHPKEKAPRATSNGTAITAAP